MITNTQHPAKTFTKYNFYMLSVMTSLKTKHNKAYSLHPQCPAAQFLMDSEDKQSGIKSNTFDPWWRTLEFVCIIHNYHKPVCPGNMALGERQGAGILKHTWPISFMTMTWRCQEPL